MVVKKTEKIVKRSFLVYFQYSFNIKKGVYMIVTVGNTKGGVGKTTLAVSLAISRALSGRDVWLIDGDRQGTAQTAINIRSENGVVPGIACATYPDGATLRTQVLARSAGIK